MKLPRHPTDDLGVIDAPMLRAMNNSDSNSSNAEKLRKWVVQAPMRVFLTYYFSYK